MKKILLAFILCIVAFPAWAQCNGIFPAKTLCGNLGNSPAPPSAFASSGSVVGPVTTVVGQVAQWGNITGTLLTSTTYPFLAIGSSTGSGHQAYDLYGDAGSDAVDNNGSGSAREFPPQFNLGYNRTGSLVDNADLYIERAAQNLPGTAPWVFNANQFALELQASWPQTSAGVSTTNAIVTSGGTSAGNHAPQNAQLIAATGFGDTALEVDGYGGMIQTLYVQAFAGANVGGRDGTGIFPKYLIKGVTAGAAADTIGLELDFQGIPGNGEMFQLNSTDTSGGTVKSLFEVKGPLNTSGGTVTANGGFADASLSGSLALTGGTLTVDAGSGSNNAFVTMVARNSGVAQTANLEVSQLGAFVMLPYASGGDQSVSIGAASPVNGNMLNVAGKVGTTTAYLNSSSAPTLSSCGTGSPTATAASSNQGGTFTIGGGSPTACTATFANAYPNAAQCVIAVANASAVGVSGGTYISAQSKTAFTITLGTGTSGASYNYACNGN